MEFFINILPAVLPLIAALIVCITSFVRDFSIGKFTVIFAIVVIVFYIIGAIAKKILRKHYDAAIATYREKKRAEREAAIEAKIQEIEKEKEKMKLERQKAVEQARQQLGQ